MTRAASSTPGGWYKAGMKPPPDMYKLFSADLRAADSTPAEVKRSVPLFSSYASKKWAAVSDKVKARFAARAAELRASALDELKARKAAKKTAMRGVRAPEGWELVAASGDIKKHFVHIATGVLCFGKVCTKVDAAERAAKKSARNAARAASDDE
jgi:hypothetical protein